MKQVTSEANIHLRGAVHVVGCTKPFPTWAAVEVQVGGHPDDLHAVVWYVGDVESGEALVAALEDAAKGLRAWVDEHTFIYGGRGLPDLSTIEVCLLCYEDYGWGKPRGHLA